MALSANSLGLVRWISVGLFFVAFAQTPAWSANWTTTKQLVLKGTYSDNVDLTDSSKGGDFFFEATPGIVVLGEGRRLKLDLAYSLQAIQYLSENSKNKLNNRLQANATSEIYRDHLFLDANATARQELVDPFGASSTDSANLSNNLQTTYTYSVAPIYKNRFGRFADLKLRFENNGVFYSDKGDDSLGYLSSLELLSGSALGALQLGLKVDDEYVDYQDASGNRFSKIVGGVAYQFDRRWQLQVLGGYEKNDYVSLGEESGILWQSLVTWTPNTRTSLKAGIGERYFGWVPSLEFSYRRKRSVWDFSYTRDISSARTDRQRTTVYSFQDAFGETVTPDTGASVALSADTSLPTSSVYVSNRFAAAWTLKMRRSSLNLSIGYLLREYEASTQNETTSSARVAWSHNLSRRTTANLGFRWSERERVDRNGDETLAQRDESIFESGLTHQLSSHTSTDLKYTFRDSTDGTENRIALGLRITW